MIFIASLNDGMDCLIVKDISSCNIVMQYMSFYNCKDDSNK